MTRIYHIAITFIAVVLAYWVYVLAAVPWIEPAPAKVERGGDWEEAREAAIESRRRRIEELAGLFPADAWELKDPKILESDRVKLLVQDYTNLGEGKVEIRPCTIIYTPDGPPDTLAQRRRASVILEAPDGALLQFDEALDLRRAKIGKLQSGRLRGRITIRSQGEDPGSEDDLWMVTRDVELTPSHVWTQHEVSFRYGPHSGSGEQMLIKLVPGKDDAPGRGPSVEGIELFEVRKLLGLHIEFGQGGFVPVGDPRAKANEGAAAEAVPVDITCRGPFRFEPGRQLASFADRVEVRRINARGPADRMTCDLLAIYFARTRKGVTPAADVEGDPPKPKRKRDGKGPVDFNLRPRRLVARGKPAVIDAPSEQAYVRGERLEYDLATERVLLEDPKEVALRQAGSEIHARSVRYESAGPGRLGQVTALGPGWLRADVPDRLDRPLEARWNESLQVRPHEGEHVISLTGGAELAFGGQGRMEAGEIHFWLFEDPPANEGGDPRIRPDRMLALRQVKLESPQLSGNVEQLGVWFEQGPEAGAPAGAAPDSAREGLVPVSEWRGGPAATEVVRRLPPVERTVLRPTGDGSAVPDSPRPNTPRVANTLEPVRRPGVPTAGLPGGSVTGLAGPSPQGHLDVAGRLLQARVAFNGTETKLAELTVEDQVQIRVTGAPGADSTDPPVVLRGERVHLIDASQPHAAATLVGRPAQFQGNGLALTASNINLNRGTNRLWVDGPGHMELAMDRLPVDGALTGGAGPASGEAGPLAIDWQRQMEFDGRTIRFEEQVVAAGRQQSLRTATLEVVLKRPIRFADPQVDGEVQVEQVRCRGGVHMENRSTDQGRLASVETMEVGDLAINLITGSTTAAGPGWLKSVRRGSPQAVTTVLTGSGAATPAGDDGLSYLHVRFQGDVTGNVHHRRLVFHDQVKAVYGPVDAWDATLPTDDPRKLGPGGVLMSCDELGVTQMPLPAGTGTSAEMDAQGNVLVEGLLNAGQTFTARANRMTYAQAKELLILEGDGRSDAELFYQRRVGGATSKASALRIQYWLSTGHLKVDGGRSAEVNLFSGGNGQ